MSELQRTIVSKVENNHTYTNTANYWAPLEYNDEEEESDHCLSMTKTTNRNLKHILSSWINQRIRKDKLFV
jgi:hypothetical protein